MHNKTDRLSGQTLQSSDALLTVIEKFLANKYWQFMDFDNNNKYYLSKVLN